MPRLNIQVPSEVETHEDIEPSGKKADVQAWMNRISVCEKFHEKEFKDKTERFLEYYAGEFYTDKVDYDRIAVNLTFSTSNNLIAGLFIQNPEVIVRPRAEAYEKGAEILQSVFPGILEENGFEDQNEACIVDAILTGLGWSKIVYDASKDIPVAMRASPFNVLFPPSVSGLYDMDSVPYVVHRIQKPLSRVKKNKNYENTDKLRAERKIKFRPDSLASQRYDSDVDLVTLYEIHDFDEGKIITLAQDMKLRVIDNPDDYRSRFVPLFYYYVPDNPFPVALTQIYEPQQLEKNQIRTQMAAHRKRSIPKFIGTKGTLSQENMDRFESSEDSSYFEAKAGPDSVRALQHANLSLDVYNLDGIVDRDTDKLTGVTAMMQGMQTSKEQTATESQIVNQYSKVRITKLNRKTDKFMIQQISLMAKSMMKFWDEPKFTKLSGIPGWHKFTGADIKGDYIFNFSQESSRPDSKDAQVQRMMLFADAMSKIAAAQAQVAQIYPNVNFEPLLKKAAMLFEQKEISRIFPEAQEVLPPAEMGGPEGELPLEAQMDMEGLGIPEVNQEVEKP